MRVAQLEWHLTRYPTVTVGDVLVVATGGEDVEKFDVLAVAPGRSASLIDTGAPSSQRACAADADDGARADVEVDFVPALDAPAAPAAPAKRASNDDDDGDGDIAAAPPAGAPPTTS